MRKIGMALAALLSVCGPALAAEEEVATALIDTGPVPCDNQGRYNYWVNPFNFPVKVRSITMWMGLFTNAKADLGAWVINYQGMVARYAHDRYANPSTPGEVTYQYSPDYIKVPAHDQLAIGHLCTPVPGSSTNTHLWVLITYKGAYN